MNGALVDKQAIKSISDTFRVEDRVKKGKAELFNAESIVLRAELERTRLLNEAAKIYQLAKEAAKTMSEAKDQ